MSVVASVAASLSLISVSVCVHVGLMVRRVPLSSVGYNYFTLVERRQAWRGVTAMLSHVDQDAHWKGVVHMVVNILGLLMASSYEYRVGAYEYLKAMFIVSFASTTNIAFCCYWIIRLSRSSRRLTRLRNNIRGSWYICGLSSGICGILSAASMKYDLITEIQIPPFMMLLSYISLGMWFMPKANFAAYSSGMFFGIIGGLGGFEWITAYFFFSLIGWTLVLLIVSLKMTTRFPVPCIRIYTEDQWTELQESAVRTEIVDGQVVFAPEVQIEEDARNENMDAALVEDEQIRLVDGV
eukprot:CAMPEP_0114492196 /NCGR_PEP_ID=MMETSP0109-20121206/3418_1 /TAXON_ID=29199 /ORGANISM="Chlorarachnion reptans, Strain CCCM449" /LENGTH=295 /DNA_ID=CAMNT_0001669007 /DNA_START=40 /DNA_END=927 /DNA_ORIENTATION=-